jgi:hypothetical protein
MKCGRGTRRTNCPDLFNVCGTRRAGELLLEAREQVATFKWSGWLSKNFALSKMTAWRYMRLAEKAAQGQSYRHDIQR